MARVAVFAGPSLRRNLQGSAGALAYTFLPPLDGEVRVPERAAFAAALVEIDAGGAALPVKELRQALGRRPLGSVSLRCDQKVLKRSARLGFDFHLASWGRGDPPPREVLAHIAAARSREAARGRRQEVGRQLKRTAQRLGILTDIVKTANSILEPRKVIELIMQKIQQLIPCEAWSMLMLDEEKGELTFELALG
ncbi:MAG TPA: hypothetical protein VFO85_15490, partial [Vicinamibacteria bacterium]|nr:hypothetical protein [Vicinamibacteria bacterium]